MQRPCPVFCPRLNFTIQVHFCRAQTGLAGSWVLWAFVDLALNNVSLLFFYLLCFQPLVYFLPFDCVRAKPLRCSFCLVLPLWIKGLFTFFFNEQSAGKRMLLCDRTKASPPLWKWHKSQHHTCDKQCRSYNGFLLALPITTVNADGW